MERRTKKGYTEELTTKGLYIQKKPNKGGGEHLKGGTEMQQKHQRPTR